MSRDLFPVLQYRDARTAIDWLEQAFGLEPVAVHEAPDGTIAHAELRHGDGMVMLGSTPAAGGGGRFGDRAGQGWVYAVVADADAHHARAVAAGATIVMELTDQDYGSRDFSARDPEGNLWSFGTYRPGGEPQD
jgi:uncharacterized glyoxalase superfamily protein PhnB